MTFQVVDEPVTFDDKESNKKSTIKTRINLSDGVSKMTCMISAKYYDELVSKAFASANRSVAEITGFDDRKIQYMGSQHRKTINSRSWQNITKTKVSYKLCHSNLGLE